MRRVPAGTRISGPVAATPFAHIPRVSQKIAGSDPRAAGRASLSGPEFQTRTDFPPYPFCSRCGISCSFPVTFSGHAFRPVVLLIDRRVRRRVHALLLRLLIHVRAPMPLSHRRNCHSALHPHSRSGLHRNAASVPSIAPMFTKYRDNPEMSGAGAAGSPVRTFSSARLVRAYSYMKQAHMHGRPRSPTAWHGRCS